MTRYAQRTLIGQATVGNWGKAASTFNPMLATGGNTTTSISQYGQTYNVHTFTSGGTFTVASLGDDPEVEYLIVAGGGAGNGASGGGAGGLFLGFFVPTAVAYTVTVGGAGSTSSISGTGLTTMTAVAGGAGGGGYSNGASGGSGGGAGNGNAYNIPIGGGSSLTAPAANGGFGVAFGNAGGHCIDNDDYCSGGGARASGQSRDRGFEPGGQGLPLAFNHATTSTTYATGGARADNSPVVGPANTGDGGGGGGTLSGGSGIIILRYRAS